MAVLRALDGALLLTMRTRAHARSIEQPALALTRTGQHGALWFTIAAVGALVQPRRRPQYARAARATLVAYLVNTVTKSLVGRPRPVLENLPPLTPTISKLSYPSAHATTSFAGALALGRVLPRAPLLILAATMAATRVYAGVHYPSDVLAGAALGSSIEALVP